MHCEKFYYYFSNTEDGLIVYRVSCVEKKEMLLQRLSVFPIISTLMESFEVWVTISSDTKTKCKADISSGLCAESSPWKLSKNFLVNRSGAERGKFTRILELTRKTLRH